jgi:hypothetical protein
VRGVALGLYPGDTRVGEEIGEIAALGATHVALVVTWAQANVTADQISPGKVTVDDRTVRAAIARAHREQLAVLLFPILTVTKTRSGQWRGTIVPRDRNKWWLSYEDFILHYATIAADTGVAAFLIGSELSSTESWRDRWYHLISRVERTYSGALVYSANWDHYPHVSFWRRLDYFGVTGYFELTDDRDASTADLTRAWCKQRRDLIAIAAARKLPLWITEVGYTSTDGSAKKPWDYTSKARVDLEEQRRAYAAFRAAWNGVDALDGVFFWNWYGKGGSRDKSYTPRGKPAEAVLRSWYGGQEQNRASP